MDFNSFLSSLPVEIRTAVIALAVIGVTVVGACLLLVKASIEARAERIKDHAKVQDAIEQMQITAITRQDKEHDFVLESAKHEREERDRIGKLVDDMRIDYINRSKLWEHALELARVEIADAHEQAKSAEAELKELQTSSAGQMEAMRADIARLVKDLGASADATSRQEIKVELLQKELSDMRTAMTRKIDELADAERKMGDQTREIERLRNEVNRLKSEATTSRKLAGELAAEVKALQVQAQVGTGPLVDINVFPAEAEDATLTEDLQRYHSVATSAQSNATELSTPEVDPPSPATIHSPVAPRKSKGTP